MAINDVYRVTLNWTVGGNPASNVFHVKQTAADNGDPIGQTIANGIGELITANILGRLSNVTVLNNFVVQRIYPTPAQAEVYSGPITGTGAGSPLPLGTDLTQSTYTAEISKKGRGRIRWTGIDAAEITNTNFTTATIADFNSLMAALAAAWSAAGATLTFTLVVWSAIDTAARAIIYAKANANPRAFRPRRRGA